MTKLDEKKLSKVRALMEGGATQGERDAARQSFEAMAAKAGVTFDEAMAFINRPEPVAVKTMSGGGLFEALFNTPEMKAEFAERERNKAIRRAELIAEYGSQEAVLAETAIETALREAVEPLRDWKTHIDLKGGVHRYISGLAGWGEFDGRENIPDSVRAAVTEAVALPGSVAGVFAELRTLDRLRDDRGQFIEHYEPHLEVTVREYVLEDLMEKMPAVGMENVEARIAWARWMAERSLFQYHDQAFLDRIKEDVRGLLGGDA